MELTRQPPNNDRQRLRQRHDAHRDSLSNAKDFAEELQALLRQDQDFQHSDVAFCSEPAIACLSMHRAGKPVIGYFGVHIAFMLNEGEEQKSLYQAFVDELSQDPRNSFATKAPYLSLQIYSHTSLKFPSVRPLSLYTQPVTYSGAKSTEILLNRRPVLFWNRRLLLNSVAYLNGFDLKFQEVKSLSDKTFSNWLSHRAGLYFPYDWLQTMGFYDWINMAFPTFVPDTPMYTYTMMGTNHRGWTATIFSPPNDLYPYKYQDWNDLESRVFWWHMTDFKVLPTVQLFQSLPQLFQMLTQASMNSISAEMRLQHLQRTHSTAKYWQESLLRAAMRQEKRRTNAWQVMGAKFGDVMGVLVLHRNLLSAAWSHKEWDDGLVEHAKVLALFNDYLTKAPLERNQPPSFTTPCSLLADDHYLGGYEGPSHGSDFIDLSVERLNGEGCKFKVSGSCTGREVYWMVSKQLPQKKGGKLTLHYLDSPLILDKGLQQQGIVGKAATLSCTSVPTDLYAAWCALTEELQTCEGDLALEGVTRIAGAETAKNLHHLPKSLEHLSFGLDFNRSLEGVTLPSSLQSLTFGHKFYQSLERVTLPSSLQSLTFGRWFNQSLERVTLPNSLQTLTFGDLFNQSLERVTLPSSLKTLTFGDGFDQSLEGVTLPSSLQSLTFGFFFNQSMEQVTLPSSLQTLTFEGQFNQSLERVTLPSSLQTLTFEGQFNQSLERVTLPSSLRTLTFGRWFNQSLERVTFPNSLQTLTFGDQFDQSLEGTLTFGDQFDQSLEGVTLPSSLHSLTFGDQCNQSLEQVTLPSSLQTLTFGAQFNQSLERVTFPNSLQTLTFGDQFNQSLERVTLPSNLWTLTFGDLFNQSLEQVTLPSSLQTLTFEGQFNQSLERTLTFGDQFDQSLEGVTLPSSLHSLTFGDQFNQSLEQVTLPSSLQTLTFGAQFNQSLERVTFPNSLQTLTFGDQFNQSLERVTLPSSLRTLTFGDLFNQSLKRVTLPSSLRTLAFGDQFDQSLGGVTLPSSLQSLTFGFFFNQCMEQVTLPSSLQTLTFGDQFDKGLEGVTFPSSIHSLTLGRQFNQSLERVTLPSCLEHFKQGSVLVSKA
eukprot:s1706_g3.t1